MSRIEDFESLLKEVVNGKRLSASRMEKLTDIAMRNMDSDTQLVSILYRTHKSISSSAKISSLYVFDALSRAAHSHAQKRQLPVDMYAEKGNSARFLVKIGGVLEGMIRDIATNLPEAKEKTRKILDIWTKANTFPADLLSSLKEIGLAEAGKPAAKEPELLRQSTPTTDPRKHSNLTPPQIPTPPMRSVPAPPTASISLNSSIPTPEAAQAALLALLASAAGSKRVQSQILANTGAQVSQGGKPSYNIPIANTGPNRSTDPRNHAGPSTLPVSRTISEHGLDHRGQPTNARVQREDDYEVYNRNDRAHQYEDRRHGGHRGGRGGFNHIERNDYKRYGKEPRNEGRDRWDQNTAGLSGDRRRYSSRSRSPGPQRRELAPQSPRRSYDDSRQRPFSRERDDGRDEFGRELRASSVDKDDDTRRSSEEPAAAAAATRISRRDGSAQSPVSPTVSTRSRTPTIALHTPPPPQQQQQQRGSVQKQGIASFDITTFNPTDADCWRALGEAFEVTNGYPPTQEDVQQFVAASMSMAVGMNMGMGADMGMAMGAVQKEAQVMQGYSDIGPSDWPQASQGMGEQNNAQVVGGQTAGQSSDAPMGGAGGHV